MELRGRISGYRGGVRRRLFLAVAWAGLVLAGDLRAGAGGEPVPPELRPGRRTAPCGSITFSGNVMYVGGQFTIVRPPGAAPGSGEVKRQNVAAFNATSGAVLEVESRCERHRAHDRGCVHPRLSGRVRSRRSAAARARTSPPSRRRARWPAWNPGANASRCSSSGSGRTASCSSAATSAGIARARPAPDRLDRPFGQRARHRVGAGDRPDLAASPARPAAPPRVFTIAFSSNGKRVYFGGHFGTVDGVTRNEIAEVPIDTGRKVLAFNPNIYAAANCPTCTTVETSRVYNIISDGRRRIYTCGGYWKVNGDKTSYNVSAFDPTSGTCLTGFNQQDDGDTPGCTMRQRRPLRRRPLQRRRTELQAGQHVAVLDPPPRGGLRHARQHARCVEPRRELGPRPARDRKRRLARRVRRLLHAHGRPQPAGSGALPGRAPALIAGGGITGGPYPRAGRSLACASHLDDDGQHHRPLAGRARGQLGQRVVQALLHDVHLGGAAGPGTRRAPARRPRGPARPASRRSSSGASNPRTMISGSASTSAESAAIVATTIRRRREPRWRRSRSTTSRTFPTDRPSTRIVPASI